MRLMLATIICATPALPAFAHVLDSDTDLATRLGHQLTGSHHWPLLLLALVSIVVCARLVRRRRASSRIRGE